MRLKITIPFLIAFLIFAGMSSTVETSEQKTGAPEIRLDGGSRGPIDFPHHRHQKALTDCSFCHDIFPQQAGVIKAMKSEGKLERKEVMNHCRKCHRDMTAEGKKSGPTSCKSCHRK